MSESPEDVLHDALTSLGRTSAQSVEWKRTLALEALRALVRQRDFLERDRNEREREVHKLEAENAQLRLERDAKKGKIRALSNIRNSQGKQIADLVAENAQLRKERDENAAGYIGLKAENAALGNQLSDMNDSLLLLERVVDAARHLRATDFITTPETDLRRRFREALDELDRKETE